MESRLFTSESVSDGHPDKVCDQISDALLDLHIDSDAEARAGIECLCAKNFLVIAGEVRSHVSHEREKIEETARKVISEIGYDFDGFNSSDIEIDVRIQPQSSDIAAGVDRRSRRSEGAGDQGMMFGYACDETKALMPAPIEYSNKILRRMKQRRLEGVLPGLKPDSKAQVTMEYGDNESIRCATVLVSSHHDPDLSVEDVRSIIEPEIRAALGEGLIDDRTQILVNPTGRFVVGGPESDTGLTGRKIIVDTYGGAALHGGGAFSGKDPTKVDRSGAYVARYLAKNVVAAGLAKRCEIQIAYAIGVPEPVSVLVNTHGTSQVPESDISQTLIKLVDLTPRGIIERLVLDRPIYRRTSVFGHFGRHPEEDGGFSWEHTDLASDLKAAV